MPGSARLRDCEVLQKIMSKQAEEKRLYGAICAAPAVTLKPWGLLKKKQVATLGLFWLKFNEYMHINVSWLANCGVVCPARRLVTLHSWTSFQPSGLLNLAFKFQESLQQAVVPELLLSFLFPWWSSCSESQLPKRLDKCW